jgi:hypothetical protein
VDCGQQWTTKKDKNARSSLLLVASREPEVEATSAFQFSRRSLSSWLKVDSVIKQECGSCTYVPVLAIRKQQQHNNNERRQLNFFSRTRRQNIMSITYEEALATLQAMFGEPWTRETLDKVLRHEKGHMENTCDRILNHGSQDPQLLIAKLSGPDPQLALDEQLARQLASGSRGGSKKSSAAVKNGRGTPTDLPDDFLRIPGFKHTSSSAAAGGSNQVMDDAQLARMLQDELFSEELARNPDFAHLARGRRRGAPPGTRRVSASNAGGPRPSAVDDGPNILEKISGMYHI